MRGWVLLDWTSDAGASQDSPGVQQALYSESLCLQVATLPGLSLSTSTAWLISIECQKRVFMGKNNGLLTSMMNARKGLSFGEISGVQITWTGSTYFRHTHILAYKYPRRPVLLVLAMIPQAKPWNDPTSESLDSISLTLFIKVTKFCLWNWGICLEWIFHAWRWSENTKEQWVGTFWTHHMNYYFSHLLINATYFKTSEAIKKNCAWLNGLRSVCNRQMRCGPT